MNEWLSLVADIIGIAGALFALFAWLQSRQLKQEYDKEKARQHKKVQVVLQHGVNKIELPVELRRDELTRSEILGRIGMIKSGSRFSIAYLNTPEFLKQINQTIEGQDEGILTIPCTQDELEQFQAQ